MNRTHLKLAFHNTTQRKPVPNKQNMNNNKNPHLNSVMERKFNLSSFVLTGTFGKETDGLFHLKIRHESRHSHIKFSCDPFKELQ